MNQFVAHVQYDDYKGTVAADRSDESSLVEMLREKGIVNAGERLVALRFSFWENPSRAIEEISLIAYLVNGELKQEHEELRAIDFEIPVSEFFRYFKRFDLVMSANGVDLSNATVDGPHYD
ncbi:MAG: hypothetical protein VX202_02865 [Pseudomonadota bacterium]|nr:hypothetical protein [Pseudomonadota bacterium]